MHKTRYAKRLMLAISACRVVGWKAVAAVSRDLLCKLV